MIFTNTLAIRHPKIIACSVVQILMAFTMLSLSNWVLAEQVLVKGQYHFHYSAFPSTVLSADIAKQYKLKRSRYRGIINISPQIIAGNNITAIKTDISGHARNLLGNTKKLNFKEVIEGNTIYYLADYGFSNEEVLNFTLTLKPSHQKNGAQKAFNLDFKKKFFTDD